MDNFFLARDNMIKGQVLPNKIHNKLILKLASEIPRQLFVPDHLKGLAYSDGEIELAGGRFILPPVVLLRMIEEADVSKDDNVLDIAVGMGYSSAILAGLAKNVVAIESDSELATKANAILKKMEISNVLVLNNKLQDGHPESAPYDVILINGAIEGTPHALIDQLAEGGRLIAPMRQIRYGGVVSMFTRNGGKVSRTDLFDAEIEEIPEFCA
jgi:protein-L-isoaspartate(D-aspartate) O-methyltransferase